MGPLKKTSQGILDTIYLKKKRPDTTVVKQDKVHEKGPTSSRLFLAASLLKKSVSSKGTSGTTRPAW